MRANIINSQEKKLDQLLRQIKSLKDDDELKAHLARYFCIRISGYLENVVKLLVNGFCEGSSPQPMVNYIDKDLKNLTNLSEEKLLKFLKKFSDDWEHQVSEKLTETQRSSLNSIISNRNNIAHGQGDSISPKIIETYYSDLKQVVEILTTVVKKTSGRKVN
jgi:hypothetical protein